MDIEGYQTDMVIFHWIYLNELDNSFFKTSQHLKFAGNYILCLKICRKVLDGNLKTWESCMPVKNYFLKYVSKIFGRACPKNSFAYYIHCFHSACMFSIIKNNVTWKCPYSLFAQDLENINYCTGWQQVKEADGAAGY